MRVYFTATKRAVDVRYNPFDEFPRQEIENYLKFISSEINTVSKIPGLCEFVKKLKNLEGLAEDARFEKLSRELRVQKDGRIA